MLVDLVRRSDIGFVTKLLWAVVAHESFEDPTIRLVTRAARDQVVDRRKVGEPPDP